MPLPHPPKNARYAVSTITLEIPLDTPITQDSPTPYTYAEGGTTKPILTTDTVLVTIYYPSQLAKEHNHGQALDWLEAPKLRSIGGLLKYAGIPKYLAVPIILPAYSVVSQKLPVVVDAPLASEGLEGGFPVAVFSHGMGGTRTTYSAYCTSLAGSGIVVAAVEHRDGSSASTTIHHPLDKDNHTGGGGLLRWFTGRSNGVENKIYVRPTEVDGKPEPLDFRRAQVEFRRKEVLAALNILTDVSAGKGSTLVNSCTRTTRNDAKTRDHRSTILAGFSDKLKMSDPWLIGHSFGGSTAIQTLRQSDCPFGQALVLDPWVEPVLITGVNVVPVSKPLYTINSEDFTQWKSHMDDVTTICRESKASTGGKGWLLTLGAEGTEKSDAAAAAASARVRPPSRLVIVHDMFGTLFGLGACIEALVSLFPDQLKEAKGMPKIVPELVVMDWFHGTQRDFTYSSICGQYKSIAEVFKGTLPRVLLQADILPKKGADANAKPLAQAGSFADGGAAEEALNDPFDAVVTETMMGALKQLRPRPGMVDALTRIYRDRDGKGRLPSGVDKVDVWAATNGSLQLGRSSFLRALGDTDGADIDSEAARSGRSAQDNAIGSGIGLFSCDEVGVAKPDPKVYAELLRRINAEPLDPNSAKKEYQGIWFVASHTWDTFAAKKAGFRTAWVTYEEHYSCPSVYGTPDVVGRNMKEVAEKILAFERDLASKSDGKALKGWTYSKGEQVQENKASQHVSFSDFPFLLPNMTKFAGSLSSQSILEVNSEIARRMVLDGKREESEGVFSALKGEKDGTIWRIWKEGKERPANLEEKNMGSDGNRLGRLVVHAL
ncbi:hypothetical protein NDA17_002483 [Ustilago hordei]|nr:hypothetical protein NDA17_002483 [Ustilago hordei]